MVGLPSSMRTFRVPTCGVLSNGTLDESGVDAQGILRVETFAGHHQFQ